MFKVLGFVQLAPSIDKVACVNKAIIEIPCRFCGKCVKEFKGIKFKELSELAVSFEQLIKKIKR